MPLWKYAAHTKPTSSHHRAFWEALDEALPEALRKRIEPGGDLRGVWEAEPSEIRAKPAAATAPATPGKHPNPLPVPWYSQRDSRTDQALRMCFSSSCAMLLEYLRPGTLKGANGDDQYLQRVQRFGDTTNATAQLQALSSYGIKARFVQDGEFRMIEKQISRGVPVPCGYLHRGPVDRPRGGGHWLTVVGTTAKGIIVHDPFGEADLITGATLDRPARFCEYSRQNFGKRWMVEPMGGGVYRYAPGNGWAIVAEP